MSGLDGLKDASGMSNIEIGSVWTGRAADEVTVTGVSRDYVAYSFSYGNGESDSAYYTLANFEKHHKLLRGADMVNEPPHYKDESGIECIEVTSQGRKDDNAKRRYSLLPTGTVNSVVDVLEFGAIKYAPDNWQKVPDARRRYYDAAMRHIDSWFGGDVRDKETGLPHLAHAVCCLLFLIWFDSKE